MTHAVRTRIRTLCLAVFPAGIAFGLLLLLPFAALSQTPSFSTHSFTSAVNNSVVLHGDLNNDGYEDLIMSTNSGASRVYLSKGSGAYTALAASIGASPQLLGDFNGDGKLDLIAGNHIYLGHGDGTFGSAGVIAFPPGSTLGVAAPDVNHDGKTDLLILTAAPSQPDEVPPSSIQVLFGNGDGTFRTGPETPIDNYDDGCCVAVQFLTGDFNGDSNVDAVFASGWGAPQGYYGTRVRVFSGNGNGNFSLTSNDQDSVILNLSVADVNGDGISDLIGTAVAYSNDEYEILGQLYVYYGQSNGGMTQGWITVNKWGVGQVAVADFNGDGVPDVAVFETDCSAASECTLTSAATMSVLPAMGNGNFGPDTPISKLESNPGPLFALRGNRDIKADLVFTNPTSQNTPIVTLLNTTTGNFPTCVPPNAAQGISVCSPASGSAASPVNFAIGAAAPEPIRKIELWADGKKQMEQFAGAFSNYGFLDASVPLASGSHRINVIAAGWDNSLQSKVFTLNVAASSSCGAPSSAGVHICSPVSGSSVSSPVKVQAAANVTGTIAHTQLWVDGVSKFTSASTTLTTSISVAAGTHRFAVVATNTAGQKWESAINATVK